MLRIQKVFLIISTVAVVALFLAGYFSYQLYVAKQNPQAVAQKETASLVEKVSKIIVLPQGETPTVATVSDPEVLKDQPFFLQAEKGDKVLIYAQAKKAILYSVSLNKILNVAPLNVGDKATTIAPAQTINPTSIPSTSIKKKK
ncbi:hypothetical protein HY311_01530 [Candidatus Nomurabacteria bacterium]|nr:hypothetical protein [Candidatus Nomurabacteria bacterium]